MLRKYSLISLSDQVFDNVPVQSSSASLLLLPLLHRNRGAEKIFEETRNFPARGSWGVKKAPAGCNSCDGIRVLPKFIGIY